MNFFNDVRAAAKTFSAIRKARKDGADSAEIKVRAVKTLPVVKLGYWGQTMEGSLFYGKEWQPIRDVFGSFDEATQHALTFTPEAGEWADRARFWQQQLRPALPPDAYHAAMLKIIRWYARCVRRRLEAWS